MLGKVLGHVIEVGFVKSAVLVHVAEDDVDQQAGNCEKGQATSKTLQELASIKMAQESPKKKRM